jgi:uncharacterized phage protein (TIGR01671 family)
MERELKFKAWDVQLNKMFDGDQIEESKTIKTYLSYGQLTIGCFPKFKDYYELIPLQFTGKKDKKGKEIYEGDVCKCRYYKHSEKDLYLTQKVVFEHASFFVVVGDLKPDLETETYTNCPLSWVNEIEIIGNIYENPELINGVS